MTVRNDMPQNSFTYRSLRVFYYCFVTAVLMHSNSSLRFFSHSFLTLIIFFSSISSSFSISCFFPLFMSFFFIIFALMESIITKIRRCLRWVRRFRKRCGYGIHSPFAFQLVTGVIYEKGEYYDYEKLSQLDTCRSGLRLKDLRLLFRVVNHHQPATSWILGKTSKVTVSYLKAGKKHCDWRYMNTSQFIPSSSDALTPVAFVYCDLSRYDVSSLSQIIDYADGSSLFVFHGIHSNAVALQFWQQLIAQPKVRVTFDLYDFGLVYFEERLNKENYKINYF